MLKCKNCGQTNKVWTYEGTVAIGKGSFTLDENGQVKNAGPVQITAAVKAGVDLTQTRNVKMVCPACGTSGKFDDVCILQLVCALTGDIDRVKHVAVRPIEGAAEPVKIALRHDLDGWAITLPAII